MRWGHDLGDLSGVAYSLRLRTVPLRNLGANMSPETAFEVMSGLETLGRRMERHCANAKKAAEYLLDHELVELLIGLPNKFKMFYGQQRMPSTFYHCY